MEAAKLDLDTPVDMRAEEGRIIIEPLHEHDFDLNELLAKITPENIHDEVDFGAPVRQGRALMPATYIPGGRRHCLASILAAGGT